MTVPVWLYFQTEVLDPRGVGASFSAVSLADELGVEPADASEWIDRYLVAQRAPRSQTRYVLVRSGRTSAAVWTIGRRTQDGRDRLAQFGDDVTTTLRRAVRPDIHRLAKVNPRAAREIDGVLDPLLDNVGQIVASVVRAMGFRVADDGHGE